MQAGLTAGVIGITGCQSEADSASTIDTPDVRPPGADGVDPPVDVRGAIYIPARAYNHYQTWREYDPAEIERDLGYLSRLNLNAVRIWLSYMWWKEDRAAHVNALEHFLDTAAANHAAVVVSLFDAVGKTQPWKEVLLRDDPASAVPAAGPLSQVIENPDQWDEPREYVRWFMDRYRHDARLLAIETMNEPGWYDPAQDFARGMFQTMRENRGEVPLTVGATSLIHALEYLKWGTDILQFHYNYPRSRVAMRRVAADAMAHARRLDVPVWLTEWQRTRPSSVGFDGDIEGAEWQPKYRTLTPVIQDLGLGNFFWSLMVKPGFTPSQRKMGTVNGIFHEDGAVWNLNDARAITATSGIESFDGMERSTRPDWMRMEKIRTDH